MFFLFDVYFVVHKTVEMLKNFSNSMKMGNNNNKEERYQWNNLQNYLKLMNDKNSDGLSEFKPALKNLKNIIDLDVNEP